MRFRFCLGAALALALALSHTPSARADNFVTRWFSKPKKEEPAPAKPAGPSPEEIARVRKDQAYREYADRSSVVLKLREIAERNNDPDLMRQADQLDQRVFETFKRRSGITDRPLAEEERLLNEQVGRQVSQGNSRPSDPNPAGQASLRRD